MASERAELKQTEREHRQIQKQRNQIMSKIEESMKQCNDLISTENELVEKIESLRLAHKPNKQRLRQIDASIQKYQDVMALYENMKEDNQQLMNRIDDHFASMWSPFESKCSRWSTHELCVWLRYQYTKGRFSALVGWEDVERKLMKHQICGKHLPHFGEEMLSFVRIVEYNFNEDPSDQFLQLQHVHTMTHSAIFRKSLGMKSGLSGSNLNPTDDSDNEFEHSVNERITMNPTEGSDESASEDELEIKDEDSDGEEANNGDICDVMIDAIDALVNRHNDDFTELWSRHEEQSETWTAEDVTEWFKYQAMRLGIDEVDWSKTCDLMKQQDICGEDLTEITGVSLKLIGITDKEMQKTLVSAINRKIKVQKAAPKGTKGRSSVRLSPQKSVSIEVPEEFICPISKQIMKDPVIVFDGLYLHDPTCLSMVFCLIRIAFAKGNTYEREAIVAYMKEHNKSPITGVAAGGMVNMVFPNNGVKDKIEAFLSSNDHHSEGAQYGCVPDMKAE